LLSFLTRREVRAIADEAARDAIAGYPYVQSPFGGGVFVYADTVGWEAWRSFLADRGDPMPPRISCFINGCAREGAFLPSLFPSPDAPGPEVSSEAPVLAPAACSLSLMARLSAWLGRRNWFQSLRRKK